ncbi:MAG: sugar ABC transporter permease, partial [Actinobacteria bacterium]|nr:sugar ABC transporter permease [Actinomycetota bacterium]
MVGDRGWRKAAVVLLFLLPNLLGFLVFSVVPIMASLGLSLFRWDMLTPPIFVGLGNYIALWEDPDFWSALRHTLTFIIGYIPLVTALGLGMALLLNQPLRGRAFFRSAFFMPVVSSWVAVALIWKWLFNPVYGIVNYLLSLVGVQGPAWLFDARWAMPAIILTSVWKDLGFIAVLYLAGLQGISDDYYEAADLDGAGPLRKFRHITIPLLAPTTFFVIVNYLLSLVGVQGPAWLFDARWAMPAIILTSV